MIKILHVDDDSDTLEITRFRLCRLSSDLDIDWASSASEALQKLEENEYDAILCDYQMPGMDGLTFLQIFRKRNTRTPFIFLSSNDNGKIATEAILHGATNYYVKSKNSGIYANIAANIKTVTKKSNERAQETQPGPAPEPSEWLIDEGVDTARISPPLRSKS